MCVYSFIRLSLDDFVFMLVPRYSRRKVNTFFSHFFFLNSYLTSASRSPRLGPSILHSRPFVPSPRDLPPLRPGHRPPQNVTDHAAAASSARLVRNNLRGSISRTQWASSLLPAGWRQQQPPAAPYKVSRGAHCPRRPPQCPAGCPTRGRRGGASQGNKVTSVPALAT